MFSEKVFGSIGKRTWPRLLVGLILATGILLSGSSVGAGNSASMPPSVNPARWQIATVETLNDVQDIEGPSKSNPKLGSSLSQLLDARRQKGLTEMQDFAAQHMMTLDGDRVQVVIVTTPAAIDDLKRVVEARGGEFQSHYANLLQALVPIEALEALAERPDVQLVREPQRPVPSNELQVGSQTTEGLAASNASAWHTAGYDGSGVHIAIFDVGFEGYSGLLGSDLPASVTTYDWTGEGIGGSAHGTACAEIVYDMAYGATIDLHKVSTEVDLGNAVSQAIADGADIISMSLGWVINGPGDGTGSLADIVEDARANGIFFAVAAGNDAKVSWSGTFSDDGSGSHLWASPDQNVNYFGPGNGNAYYIPAGYPIRCGLHWDDWTDVDQDYDLILYRWTGSSWVEVTRSQNIQNGGAGQTPEEFIGVSAPEETFYAVAVLRYDATRDVCLSLDCPKMSGLDERVAQRSLSFPADSPDAITVGAVDVNSPYPLESYSSQGPTFGPGGACSGGSTKPDIAAYANVSVAAGSYGGGGFNGTSAATPHVAGAAALVKAAYPGYTVSQLQSFLEDRAIDLGAAGKDNLYGSGRLNLGTPPLLAAPGDLTATPASQTRINLSWIDNSSNESGFKIERSPNGTSGWSQIATAGANVTTYADAGLTCGTTYYYRVRAYNAGGASGYSDVANTATSPCDAPSPALTSITPSAGINTGVIHITALIGSNFQSGMTVKLTRTGQPAVIATNVTVVSSTRLTCDFDLTGAVAGQWNVVVMTSGNHTAQMTNGFTVTDIQPVYLPLVVN